MNDFSWIAGPLIGALIGYCTNYIAVKMLFRPLYPVKIGRFTLPFTPGIIPKGKDRLAKTLGAAVGETLLTREDIEHTLLTEELKTSVLTNVIGDIEHDTRTTLGSIMETHMGQERTEHLNQQMQEAITTKIVETLLKMDVGQIMAEEGRNIIMEKLQSSLFGKLLSGEKVGAIIESMGDQINSYIEQHGVEKIQPVVSEELSRVEAKPLFPMAAELGGYTQEELYQLAGRLYETLVKSKAGQVIEKIDIAGIIEEKIGQMNVRELELLTMSVIRKELNAIVNLGAVIGFFIGLINLFF